MAYLSDIEIAQQCTMRPVSEIVQIAGICEEHLEQYGRFKAKVDLGVLLGRIPYPYAPFGAIIAQ